MREKTLGPGLDLRKRDLRCADFTGSKFPDADLRGADLSGAILLNADLRSAKLMPTGGSNGVFDLPPDDFKLARIAAVAQDPETYRPVRLKRAILREAKLHGAKLILADLRDADLRGAVLERAELTQANLARAKLGRADLRGAELSRGHLEFADLVGANLIGSRLFNTDLTGADLRSAHLEGTDLTLASLKGTNLARAHLEGAQLMDAIPTGAVFRDAWLQGATSLYLNGAILRQARTKAVDFCQGVKASGQSLTDLRDANFATVARWNNIVTRLTAPQRVDLDLDAPAMMVRLGDSVNVVTKAALLRLKAARQRQDVYTCLVGDKRGNPRRAEDMAHRRLLYSEGQIQGPMRDWPPVADQGTVPGGSWGETEFLKDLTVTLWDKACTDPLLAQALAKRALGGYDPADPLLNTQLAREFVARQDETETMRACSGFHAIEDSKRLKLVEIVSRTEEEPPRIDKY